MGSNWWDWPWAYWCIRARSDTRWGRTARGAPCIRTSSRAEPTWCFRETRRWRSRWRRGWKIRLRRGNRQGERGTRLEKDFWDGETVVLLLGVDYGG